MKIKQNISWALMVAGIVVLAASCEKDMEEYAPERPVGGYLSSAEIEGENRIAYWAFENSVSDSVGSVAGTVKSTTYAGGKKGQALKGAADGYVVFDAPPAKAVSLQSFTVAFWMNTQQPDKAAGIFALTNDKDFWGSLDVYMEPYKLAGAPNPDTLFMKVHINNDNVTWKGQFIDFKIPAAVGKWVHVAATYDAGTSVFHLYANGLDLGVNSAGNPANTKGPKLRGADPANGDVFYGPIKFVNAMKMVFGTFQFQTTPSLTGNATSQTWAQNYVGLLDEFRIYDKALNAADVSALYKLEALGR